MNSDKEINSEFRSVVLNQLDTGVFITDAETDRIVYMNETMKKRFQISNPEGKFCYKVLQKDMEERCAFCNRRQLLTNPKLTDCVWNEVNTINHRLYKNYDQLFEWDGKKYFIENSIDITDLMPVEKEQKLNSNDTEFSENQAVFTQYINRARNEKKSVTVALCDINDMKFINNQYGRQEGDRLLSCFTDYFKKKLNENDLFFHLESDQFIALFYGDSYLNAENRIHQIQQSLAFEKDHGIIPYEFTFSFGLFEVYPSDHYNVDEIVIKADERLYQQQRAYHIMRSKEAYKNANKNSSLIDFDYDKEHLYDALSASSDEYLFVGNLKTGTFRYPESMVNEFGLPGQVVENAAAFWSDLIYPEDMAYFLTSNQEIADGRANSHTIEYRARNIHGEWIWLRCRGNMITDQDGLPDLFAGIITNLGKRLQIDTLTGLENKFEFEGIIKKHLFEKENQIGVMVLNIDSFKNINDLYNRSFGDEVLKLTALKLHSLLPEKAKLFRLDGDEFGIVLLNSRINETLSLYQQIQTVFNCQHDYDGRKYYFTLSAGYAAYPQDADNYQDLLKYANYSLEHSKHIGKNRMTLFSSEILKQKERKLELMELLRESIERGFIGFSLNYQPQVNSKTQQLHGAEALARWTCPKYGNVSPVEFIPLLEQSGLIVQFGNWVAYQAARQCKLWCEYQQDFKMSINLSYRQLIEGDILPFLKETLNKLELAPNNVVMELTETYLAQEDGAIKKAIAEMKDTGILLAMDDFGTGYSSLFSLKNIPVNVVKIDRGFVKEITTDMFNATFIRTITQLCHEVGKSVCLEGVESAEEYNVVKYSGIEFIQGYYFGRPMSADDFEAKYFMPLN